MLIINLKDGNAFITEGFEVRDGKFFLENNIIIDMVDVEQIESYTDPETPEEDNRQITIEEYMKGVN